jgi:hypothetical protein
MLTVLDRLPPGLVEREAARLHERLSGPTLIHLPGRRPEPLFVSVLLHGNEDTGWEALRRALGDYAGRELPRALSIFIGNVAAARAGERFLPGQPDYNRIWGIGDGPEAAMARQVVAATAERRPFACVDIHNNTGINPHYACVRRLDAGGLHLASLFQRTVVYFLKPDGVLVEPFSELCPAVTVECGRAGDAAGIAHAAEYLHACLNLSAIPAHAVPPHDIDLFHTVAIVKVPPEVSFDFVPGDADLQFAPDLDHLNFRELPAGTALARLRPGSAARLTVHDERGLDAHERFFVVRDGEIRTRLPVMPSMLTWDSRAIRQDCLCYLMERHRGFYGGTLP